ncbi:MAG: aldehyde dehydrogenase family protein [Lachnospiraceae bacterium]
MSFKSAKEYKKIADILKYQQKALINGKLTASKSGETFETICPATGEKITEVTLCRKEDVGEAVAAAKAAFEDGRWSRLEPAERKQILIRFADLIEEHAMELAVMETLDSGKPICDTVGGDIPETVECFKFHAEAIDKLQDEITNSGGSGYTLVVREPIGVVGAILPWNFPILMAAWKLAPILAAGNSVVAKPAKLTSLTLLKLAELSLEAGIPAGVFNVVPGNGIEVGDAIARHEDVNLITFTGSTAVGRELLGKAGNSNLKRVLLELGGKNPCVVMPDINDLDFTAEQILAAGLWNMGENCTQNSRVIIHQDIKDKLLAKILEKVSDWKTGDPFDADNNLGALIEEKHMNTILGYIQKGIDEGAKLVHGGKQILKESGGYFVEPTIFDETNQNMAIVREEIFGPVFAIQTFATIDEAIRIANDTEYGLQASVHSANIDNVNKLMRGIKAGVISVNHFSEGDITTPFGGFKQSGFFGRDKSVWANKQYTELKSIHIKTK